jgi:hypothetical protein
MTALRAPVTARGPWLAAVLGTGAARPLPARLVHRPAAVVVEAHPQGRPDAVAFLALHRRGPLTTVTLLGQDAAPLPGGRPAARLLARDERAAGLLAGGVLDLLHRFRGPWRLRLAGLPLGDPVLRALAAELPAAVLANERSARLVDELDATGLPVRRSTAPAELDRHLPGLLRRVPGARARTFLRVAARWSAAGGELEVATAGEDAGAPRAVLLTLLDGADRWPWWGSSEAGGLRTEMGAPLVGLTARGGPRLR